MSYQPARGTVAPEHPSIAEAIERVRISHAHRKYQRQAFNQSLACACYYCDSPELMPLLAGVRDYLDLSHIDPEAMESVAESLEDAVRPLVISLRQGAELLRTKPVNED